MKTSQVVMRVVLGLVCLALEIALVVLIVNTARRYMDDLFVWHAILMSVGLFLFLSHGAPASSLPHRCWRPHSACACSGEGLFRAVHVLPKHFAVHPRDALRPLAHVLHRRPRHRRATQDRRKLPSLHLVRFSPFAPMNQHSQPLGCAFRVHSRVGLGVLVFSLLQGTAGTLKLFVLYKTKQAPHTIFFIMMLISASLSYSKIRTQRFLRWHGRMGTLVYACATTAVLTGVYSRFDQGRW